MKELIEQIRQATYLPDVVSKYTRLNRFFKGLCPFHFERHPSFSVEPKKGLFHCFGCGAGGDSFKFIMMAEKLSFWDSVKLLAFQLNIPIPEAKTKIKKLTAEWKKKGEKLNKIKYLEVLFKKLELKAYDCLLFKRQCLPKNPEQWTREDYTQDLLIDEKFDELDRLVEERERLFDEERRVVRNV